jgi:hypothetical protein
MASKKIMAFEDHAETTQQTEQPSEHLVSLDASPTFQLLEQSGHTSEAIGQEIADIVQTSTALEAAADALGRAMGEGQMGVHGVRFANLAIESITGTLQGRSQRLAVCVEQYQRDPLTALKTAMEGVQTQADELWASIKAKLGALAQALGEKLKFFKDSMAHLEQRLLVSASNVERMQGEARSAFLKPQDWFIDVCYLGQAPPAGLKGIGKAVEDLLSESSHALSRSCHQYTQWLEENYAQATLDPNVFKGLKFKKCDFLIQNQKEFTLEQKPGLIKAQEGCAFYRGGELPGGKALFVHLSQDDEAGAAAIDALSKVYYQLEAFEPLSYNRTRLAITAGASLPVALYVGSVGGAVLGGAAGAVIAGTAPSAVSDASDYTKDADNNTHREGALPDADMVFHTLSQSQAKAVLSDVESGVQALRRMGEVVFKEVWLDEKFSQRMDSIIDKTETGSDENRLSVRLLKNTCFAIFELQGSFSSNVITYALRTYDSMLNYTEKSALQYHLT